MSARVGRGDSTHRAVARAEGRFTIVLVAIAKIRPLKDRFDATAQQSLNLVADVKTLVKPPPAGPGHPGLPQFQLNLIYELAFVRCVLAWEDFLHTSMCAYLTGARGLSGKPAQPKAKVPTLTVAEELLVGERDFLSWTKKTTVRDRAAMWFQNGEPYDTALKNFATYEELRIVRNRIVHRSASAQDRFSKLRKQKHPRIAHHGMGPGAFLARSTHAGTRLDGYVADLSAAVKYIATN